MPFIGQDWRSPGEVWIKTIEGWEPMKLLRKSHFVRHQNDQQIFYDDHQQHQHSQQQQPHQIVVASNNNNNTDVVVDEEQQNSVPCSGSLPLKSNYVDVVGHHQHTVHNHHHHRVVVLPSSSSSSLDSRGSSNSSSSSSVGPGSRSGSSSSSGSDSDSENELIGSVGVSGNATSNSVPVPSRSGCGGGDKIRHESGDSTTTTSSSSLFSSSSISSESPEPSPPSNCGVDNGSPTSLSVAEIIQRLQRSSSQPIPMDILKESSEQIEIYHTQPYYRITMNPTREVQGSNIISDAFYKLDFCNAIRDIRRFAYVSKLLHLLITQNLTSLSGNATKALFWMLEEIAKQVASNKQNIHVIRELLVELREIVDKYLCWGRPLGSTSLWEQHLRTMERICEMTDAIEIKPPENNGKPSWSELPEELIREILLRLSDYKDLERSAQACQRMNILLNEEQHIWKQLVKYHFTKDQLKWSLRFIKQQQQQQHNNNNNSLKCNSIPGQKYFPNNLEIDDIDDLDDLNGNRQSSFSSMMDWEQLFHLLRKKFGLKEEYADCLFLCRYCRCLFWKSKNHPCILENPDLTRQVLVTSPLTGFTSSNNAIHLNSTTTKPPPSSKFSAFLQKNLRKFSSGQQQQQAASSSSSSNSGENRQRSHSSHSPNLSSSTAAALSSSSSSNQRPPIFAAAAAPPPPPQPLPGGPVIVQNIPFFEHPLVIQRLNNNNNNNNGNDNDNQANNSNTNAATPFQKAPLHVPITPQAFLKFFSL